MTMKRVRIIRRNKIIRIMIRRLVAIMISRNMTRRLMITTTRGIITTMETQKE